MSDLREYVKDRLARYPGVTCALHYDLRHWLMEHPDRPVSAADDVKARAVEEAGLRWPMEDDTDAALIRHGFAFGAEWAAGLLADPVALAKAKAEALREAADDVREYMALAWGSDRPWITTGTKVANLVSDVLRDRADRIDPTEGETR